MSKDRCPECGSGLIVRLLVYLSDGSAKYECPDCGHVWLFPVERRTVFHSITRRPEVLAEVLVYFDNSTCDGNGIGYPWCSVIKPGEHYETKEKAIVATMKRLEEAEI